MLTGRNETCFAYSKEECKALKLTNSEIENNYCKKCRFYRIKDYKKKQGENK